MIRRYLVEPILDFDAGSFRLMIELALSGGELDVFLGGSTTFLVFMVSVQSVSGSCNVSLFDF